MSTLIAVEGMDKAGKTTFIKKFVHHLEQMHSLKVDTYFEPWYESAATKQLRDMVINPELSKPAQLYCGIATRMDLFSKYVIPSLTAGRTVVNDRSLLTSAVYQQDEHQDHAVIIESHMDASKRLKRNFMPDVVVFLELPYDVYMERLKADNDAEDIEVFLTNKTNYERFQRKYLEVLAYVERFYGVKVLRFNDPEQAALKLEKLLITA